MTFERAWVLAIAWLPLAWAAWEWRRTRRRVALALKALSFARDSARAGRAAPQRQRDQVAVAVLVDTSASVSPADLDARIAACAVACSPRKAATGCA